MNLVEVNFGSQAYPKQIILSLLFKNTYETCHHKDYIIIAGTC